MTSTAHARPRGVELALVALLSLLALLVLRRADLDTPYWWDAAAVYVPGSKWVAENGFAAFPGIFPSLLARGHTTLFYVVTAVPFALFGDAPPIGHAVVIAFSILGVTFTYALGAHLFGRPAGAVAALLLVISPLWLTMSSQVLPEVPLAALTAVSLYLFARGRHGLAALAGVLVVLTKETGVACPLALVGASMLWGGRERSVALVRRPILIHTIPVAVLGAFFVWQRVAEGWWVLPYHAELFGQEHDYLSQGGTVLKSMLLADGRWIATVAALGLFAWRWRDARESFAPAPAEGPPRWVSVAALALVFLANQGFFTQMWFLERYALAAHPGLVVLLAAAIVPRSLEKKRLVLPAALALLATIGVALASQYAGDDYHSGETTFRYLRMIEAHQEVYAILEAEEDPPLLLSAWPMTDELRKPYLGFVRRPYEVVGISGLRDGSDTVAQGRPIEAVITAHGLGAHEDLRREAQARGLSLAHTARVGTAVVELWR